MSDQASVLQQISDDWKNRNQDQQVEEVTPVAEPAGEPEPEPEPEPDASAVAADPVKGSRTRTAKAAPAG